MPPFLIFTLPRSRSYWLSRFLTSGNKICGHDLLVECASILDFQTAFAEYDGSVETGAIWGWRLVQALMPETRIIVVQRRLQQVLDSFSRRRIQVDPAYLLTMAIELDLLAKQPGVHSFFYEELSDESSCAKLYELTLGIPHSSLWFRLMREQNLQIDLPERLARICENQSRIAGLKAEVLVAQSILLPQRGIN